MWKPPQLTFSQAQGYEPVPKLLQLGELPREARRRIMNALMQLAESHWRVNTRTRHRELLAPLLALSRDVHADYYNRELLVWTPELVHFYSLVEATIMYDKIHKVFDFVQYILRHPECPEALVAGMKTAFAKSRLAYSIEDSGPPTIVPMVTAEEGETISSSLKQLVDAGLEGSASHLRKSSECINSRDWAGSIRESIHAVESVAKEIGQKGRNNRLKTALHALEERAALHPSLKKAILSLYGYASDEKGIRHALQNGDNPRVGMDEAVVVLGICASLASYLWRKHSAT